MITVTPNKGCVEEGYQENIREKFLVPWEFPFAEPGTLRRLGAVRQTIPLSETSGRNYVI